MLAELCDVVIGVDTHKDTHTAAVVAAGSGAVLGVETVPADAAGYGRLVELAATHGTRGWAIEGTASYGAGLTRYLQGRDELVVEVDLPGRPARRGGRKDDEIDAVRCARHALATTVHAQPRSGPCRDALALLVAARAAVVDASKTAQNQLQSFIVTAPDSVRAQLRHIRGANRRWAACAALTVEPGHDVLETTSIELLAATARRIVALEAEIRGFTAKISELVTGWRKDLLELFGVGPIGAAVVLCAWSQPGRFRSEAAFAMLAGAAPIPASSGQTVRYRLNRGGDRQLNQTLHTIAVSRLRHHPPTQAYAQRRLNEGKTLAEIRRCLKRYIARQLFRQLENPPGTP